MTQQHIFDNKKHSSWEYYHLNGHCKNLKLEGDFFNIQQGCFCVQKCCNHTDITCCTHRMDATSPSMEELATFGVWDGTLYHRCVVCKLVWVSGFKASFLMLPSDMWHVYLPQEPTNVNHHSCPYPKLPHQTHQMSRSPSTWASQPKIHMTHELPMALPKPNPLTCATPAL